MARDLSRVHKQIAILNEAKAASLNGFATPFARIIMLYLYQWNIGYKVQTIATHTPSSVIVRLGRFAVKSCMGYWWREIGAPRSVSVRVHVRADDTCAF